MAEGKNKIIVYKDWIGTFESLTDDEAGKLIKHFFRYVNDLNPEAPDRITSIAFEPIKQTLKRDLKNYEAICLRNKENGQLGGRPPDNPEEPKKPSGLFNNPNNPDKPDSDSDSDIDNVNDKRRRKPFTPPTLEQVEKYFEDNGYKTDIAKKAFMGYNEAGWFDSKGNKVLNWKQKMVNVWFKDEHKIQQKYFRPELKQVTPDMV